MDKVFGIFVCVWINVRVFISPYAFPWISEIAAYPPHPLGGLEEIERDEEWAAITWDRYDYVAAAAEHSVVLLGDLPDEYQPTQHDSARCNTNQPTGYQPRKCRAADKRLDPCRNAP